jgi:hypothetical protein
MGGLDPAIGMIGGGELGGNGVQAGETGNEPPGGKGNNRGFGEKATGLGGTKVSLFVVATVIGGGVVKTGVGKYSEVWGLDQGTTSGEIGMTRLSPLIKNQEEKT